MDDIPLDGKRVLVRCDFNVSPGADGIVDETEDYRIEAALTTIQELRQRRCRVMLLTHLGRPGEEDGTFDLKPIQRRLSDLIGDDVRMLSALYGSPVEAVMSAVEPGSVVLMPNVRLDDREMQVNENFGAEIAQHADAYINEAFSASHRAHTSMVVLPRLLPSAAGRRTISEVEALQALSVDPKHPYVAIVSGAKITTKVGLLRELLTKVDKICVGGQIANIFIAASGKWSVNKFDADEISAAQLLMKDFSEKIIVPVDVVIGDGKTTADVFPSDAIPQDATGLWDIGPKSVQNILNAVKDAATVMWNGPVGKFEVPAYETGTLSLAKGLSELGMYRVVGGGDTVNALEKYRLVSKFNHVSVGGGAMIAFLEGKRMPGLEPLEVK